MVYVNPGVPTYPRLDVKWRSYWRNKVIFILSVCLSVCLFACLSLYLSIFLPICLYVCKFVCLYICLSILYVYLSVLFDYLSICLDPSVYLLSLKTLRTFYIMGFSLLYPLQLVFLSLFPVSLFHSLPFYFQLFLSF